MRAAGSVVSPCPKCGSPVEFDTDGGGYGMTIEQCSAGCGHWRTISTVVRPAHVRAPYGVGPAAKKKAHAEGYGRIERMLLAVTPTSPAGALSAQAIARLADHDPISTRVLLNRAAERGRLNRVHVGHPNAARKSWRYWRRPV